jgi:polyhydroxybutyrate depolymerase
MYNGTDPAPLVMNFHGFGSNATEQMYYGDFRSIADTAGFLIVHPEGTLFNGTSHWNVGGWTIGSTVDDVGFTAALIDSLSAEYMIDATRIYSTGMSNGGFMSFLLGCQLNNRIAAIGSVTGSMTPETYEECNPAGSLPVLQIHGTNDPIVPYNGASYTKAIATVLEYWVDNNNCDPTPDITPLPDIAPLDGSTVDLYIYPDGDNGTTIEHYKVVGGAHTWPGNAIGGAGTNYDINASAEIWKFFARYDINGLIVPTGLPDANTQNHDLTIYPNPFTSNIYISGNVSSSSHFEVVSLMGRIVMSGNLSTGKQKINLSHLPANVYLLRIGNRSFKLLKKE